MALEDLVYALIQAVHNLGAAMLLGAPVFWLWYRPQRVTERQVLRLLGALWLVQGASGALFGAASLALYGALPDLNPAAKVALLTKITSVVTALVVLSWTASRRPATRSRAGWYALAALAALALCAAAVLRWSA